MPKVTHFTDHNGFYVTKDGHKIDDYSVRPTALADKKLDRGSPEKQTTLSPGRPARSKA